MAPKFADNIILTKTERLMMSNRPPDPKNARNKNVLVVGGSGSGKTRFWLKPNLLQCHSSYVVTDPKGSIVVECGNALLKNGYKLKILNTINFSKSMHYNPFAYVHSEKDILKLVTTLMTNTKGEGSGGDPFWEKSERLLLTALIAYLHYEAPEEEQNFATLLEMLNTGQSRTPCHGGTFWRFFHANRRQGATLRRSIRPPANQADAGWAAGSQTPPEQYPSWT